ncbi:alpha-amylase family glycosyl hydrolase [Segetibacter koreensis]|uniref:alpha-amylase family glycosyl hydrolase n=1 Tax=Segetibacter koreensis TaxID=398037 RepID=UPI000368BC77|nr:alpha-amylase family glycosyl hydrolase [Segetibacter koreensis]
MATKFKTATWAATANIYEVNLRQYTPGGTFAAFQKELPRLRDMGVDILWFMPLTPISTVKRQGTLGSYYACSNYTSVNPEFGGIEDFKQLVISAHKMGFKVLIDWVANHTGYDHIWTKQHPDFYKKNIEGHFYDSHGWEDVIDLDYTNRQLWEVMVEEMNFWILTFDIDGFRCDMAHLVPLNFWLYARTLLDRKKKLFWLAETEEPDYHEVFDATYGWELLHIMEAIYKNKASLENLLNVLETYDTIFPADALRTFFVSNHDENSHSGSEYERLGESVKAFTVLCATWKNSLPMLYSGQEMPNRKRLKFFDKDPIEWTGQYLLHDFYKVLLSVRKTCSALRAGDEQAITRIINTNALDYIFAFIRKHEENEVLVILNLSHSSRLRFKITDDFISGRFTSAFSGIEVDISSLTTFELQKWQYLLFYRTIG